MKDLPEFLQERNIKSFHHFDIKPYLTFKIGGKVEQIIIINNKKDLEDLLFVINKQDFPFIVLGGGSNVIFSDSYSPILVIINQTSQITKLNESRKIKVNSGVSTKNLISWAIANNVGGLEFLAGIPGTVGGAAAVNAGSFGQSISDVLEGAEIFIPGRNEIISVNREYFGFGYRSSIFKYGSAVIVNIFLAYKKRDSKIIRKYINSNLKYRKEKHPPKNVFTAGCFFKNPSLKNKRVSAGKLIESLGFKGLRHKHLLVSDIHSNFIINTGNSSFDDMVTLEKKIIQTAQEKIGIQLEREIIYISPAGKKY